MDDSLQTQAELIREYESRREMWRLIGRILIHTTHPDLHREASLPSLIWSSFKNFDNELAKHNIGEIVPRYLLARPLMGFKDGHDKDSPLMSSFSDSENVEAITDQARFLLEYVAVAERLSRVTNSDEGPIARRLLQTPDKEHFCYVLSRAETSPMRIGSADDIKQQRLTRQIRFTEAIEEIDIRWPPIEVRDLRDLRDVGNQYESAYAEACAGLDASVFALLEGEDKSEALVAWWLYRAQADLIFFRGFDEGSNIDPQHQYTWGGVWFLFNKVVIGEHLRALHILVRECFNIVTIEMNAREITREKERANIGAGMFHNLAHYILPLAVYSRSIGRFLESGNHVAVTATANNIDDTINRLSRFQSAVMRQVKHRKDQSAAVHETLKELPGEALLVQTRALHAALTWFVQDSEAGIGSKYLSILCDLATTTRQLNPNRSGDRKEARERLAQMTEGPVPSSESVSELIDWWRSVFGLNIIVEGDFERLRGDVFLIVGVVEELLLNALCASASVLARAQLIGTIEPIKELNHVRLRALMESSQDAILIENVADSPLNRHALFAEPQADQGWGLYGTWLLIKEAGGSLDILRDPRRAELLTNWPVTVGFRLTLPGGNDGSGS
jgi:hypothetical protein